MELAHAARSIDSTRRAASSPLTSTTSPGGLSYQEAADLLIGLARRGRVVGMNVAEHYPSLDVNGITSLVVARLVARWIGTAVRQT